jgi:hypothetical protein
VKHSSYKCREYDANQFPRLHLRIQFSTIRRWRQTSSLLPDGVKFFDELFELCASAVAEEEDLDTECAVLGDMADDAAGSKGEAVYFEAEVENVVDIDFGLKVGLEETAIEAEIDDPARGDVPAVDAEVEWAVAGVAARLAAF